MANKVASPALKVLVLGASMRTESLNRRLAALTARLVAKSGATVDHANLRDFDVPSYDGDLELGVGIPSGAQAFKRRLEACDAFVISSPEYNGAMPGTLKNLIDWTSRFRPQPFDGKQALLLSASPSLTGGNRGLWSLRVPLEHLGARLFPDMFSLAMAHKAFATGGDDLADAKLQARLEKTLQTFLSVVEAVRNYPCIKRAWVEFLGEPPGTVADRVDPPPPS
jgi:NAD(P)H-dependent FMN reductase